MDDGAPVRASTIIVKSNGRSKSILKNRLVNTLIAPSTSAENK